jgi:NAD(P)-dependent dehydrogenase (short-subunit alcohol dehydrogenase family)
MTQDSRTAIVTGASRGLGRALTRALSEAGWTVIADARDGTTLAAAVGDLPGVIAIPGNITEAAHRAELIKATGGRLDLLINNAGGLGPSPLPPVATTPADALAALFAVNVLAPLALVQAALPLLRARGGIVVDVTSDAAVEAYPGWGGYGATKAALAHLDKVLAQEEPGVTVWSLDPGDLRTEMHQAAFPGEDISDRPLPESVAPALLNLLAARPTSGRYSLSAYLTAAGAGVPA